MSLAVSLVWALVRESVYEDALIECTKEEEEEEEEEKEEVEQE